MSSMFNKLPWGSHAEPQGQQEEEQSLTSILPTPEDRSRLTLLIAECTETMRQVIVDAFDASRLGTPSDVFAPELKDEASLPSATTEAANVDDSDAAAAAQEKAKKEQKELAAREKEVSAPRMQDLKTATLKHFDDWREAVLLRVGEVVNQREEAKEQKHQARAASPKTPTPSKRQVESPKYDENVAKALKDLYPPIDTPLTELEEAHRALILHSMLLLLLSLEHYSAHSRVLLLHLTSSLKLSVNFLESDEGKIARGLLAAVEMKADEETKKKAEENSSARKWKVGIASVAGAALIGVTGGLAAPLLAAGIESVMGGLGLGATAAAGYLGTMAGSSILVGGLFGAYGGKMTGKMMDQYAKEVEDFAFVPVRTYHKPRKIEKEYRRLRVAIGITGWLTDKDDVVEPWKIIGPEMESFALRWELEALLNLGNSLTTMIKSAAWGYAKSEIIKRTVFASLTAGLWPLGLLKVSRIIDNPFSVAKSRADKAGEVLADALINRAQGERPVTLIGYSLGARVIFTCLKSLATRRAFGLVENVVLLGAPTPSDAADWRAIRAVVSGRVVNAYSSNDYILAFLYRSSSIQLGVAGLQAIPAVKGVQNVDVSDLVAGHTAYRFLTGTILKRIGFADVDLAALELEERRLAEQERDEEEERQRSEQKHAGKDQPQVPDEQQLKDLEEQVQLKNKESMMGWMTEKLKLGGATATSAAQSAKVWVATRSASVSPSKAAGSVESVDAGQAPNLPPRPSGVVEEAEEPPQMPPRPVRGADATNAAPL